MKLRFVESKFLSMPEGQFVAIRAGIDPFEKNPATLVGPTGFWTPERRDRIVLGLAAKGVAVEVVE